MSKQPLIYTGNVVRSDEKRMSVAAKIILLVIIVSIANVLIAGSMSYIELKKSYIDAKIKGNTEIAVTLADDLKHRAEKGEFSMEEAQKLALDTITAIRFDGGNFMNVMDQKTRKILKSPRYATGMDIDTIVDKNGKKYISVMADGSKKSKDGTYETEFFGTKFGSDKIVSKIGVGRDYGDWDWVVTASITKPDLNKALWKSFEGMVISSVLLIILTAIGVYFLFIKGFTKVLNDITGNLTNSTNSVSDSATHLEDSSHKLAEGSSEQAASIQEIAATIEESASMIKKTDESSNYASKLSKQSKENAVKSYQEMDKLMSAMERINKSGEEVSKIIKVIEQIAMQTNILSLNAAVEAEKAGEAGKGFAVVAEEVRNLADRSAQSAKDTARLIADSVATSKDATKLAVQVYDSIQEIEKQTNQVDALINEVAIATREQKIGMEQINQAIAQVEQVIQVNSQTAAGTSEDSRDLSAQTNILSNLTEKLFNVVKGS